MKNSLLYWAIMQPKRLILSLLFFVVMATPALAVPTLVTPNSSPKTVAPQSSTAVPVLVLTLNNTSANAMTVSSFTLQNAAAVGFGTGISNVRIAATSLANILSSDLSTPASNQRQVTLTTPQSIAGGESVNFFVLYDFSSTATLGANASAQLVSISTSHGDAVVGTGATTTNTIAVSGLAVTQSSTEMVPVAVFPGQTGVTIATFSVTMKGENLPNESTQLSVTIANPAANFVTTSGGKAGVTAAYLYKLVGGSPVLVSQITSFSSASQAIFSGISATSLQFVQDTTQTLLIKYDIGTDITVTKDATVQLQLSGISGTGSTSGLGVAMASGVPVQAVSPYIGGVTYSSLVNLVTSQNYGPGNTAPILRFTLNAVNVPVTLNQVLMGNGGNVGYVVDPSQTNGVTTIYLYADTNDNLSFDGAAFGDTLVGTRTLGSSNTAQTATVSMTSGQAIASNNAETFFALYQLGQGIAVGATTRTAQASLNNIAATSSVFAGQIVSLSGAIPVSTVPTAAITVANTNVIVESVTSMAPTSAVQGQRYVPMLYMTLVGSVPLTGATMTIRDNQGSFLVNNTGATRVYLFRDSDQDGALTVSTDALVSSVATFSSTTQASLSGVAINEGRNRFILAYDVGQVVDVAGADNVVASQLSGLSGSSLILGGDLPQPIVAATVTVNTAELSIPSVISSTTGVTNNTTAFSVTVNVQNTSTRNVSVLSVLPRFYFNDASGTDITYQFNVTAADTMPVTVTAGATRSFAFTVVPAQLATSGVVVLDGYVNYRVSTSSFAERIRYQGSTWQTAATIAPTITVQGNFTSYSWTLPDYISQMTVTHSGQTSTFQTGDAIAASSILDIQFANSGQFVDPATLTVQLASNGVTQNVAFTSSGVFLPSATPQYTYNRTTGVVEIRNIGSTNSAIVINVKDINQNVLPTAYIPFLVASEVRVSDLLFYPNPLTPGSAVKIAFNLTQPADLTFYLYNALGRLVWIYRTSIGTLGYHEVDWDGTLSVGGNIGSGTYFLKLQAVDSNGNRSSAVSRLAVY